MLNTTMAICNITKHFEYFNIRKTVKLQKIIKNFLKTKSLFLIIFYNNHLDLNPGKETK